MNVGQIFALFSLLKYLGLNLGQTLMFVAFLTSDLEIALLIVAKQKFQFEIQSDLRCNNKSLKAKHCIVLS